ncbi:LOW QUALITY PROTEIN: FERRY endosomal RAB5 effector complex subunit 3-like [Amphiura filiformis]|uniref:LOW QUALITY PROTEIN: FERRY endosomal RAB5 effector complex subunit 3-like n=1 Tax=Amphiura filiformis TaxID=82378 RepID=UPI003B21C0A0
MLDPIEKTFQFNFKTKKLLSKLTVPIQIPLDISTREFVGRLVHAHNLPCFVEEDITSQLDKFVEEETEKFHDQNADEAIQKLQTAGHDDIGNTAEKWAKAFQQECVAYAPDNRPKPDAQFAELYHKLIHSAALETLFHLEHTYAIAVEDLLMQRDNARVKLQARQEDEMKRAVQNLDITHNDRHVNALAAQHFDTTQREEAKWESELRNLQDSQRVEFRDWIQKIHDDTRHGKDGPISQRIRAMSDSHPVAPQEETVEQPRMEESFTIHLGAQMKTMHNLRLMSVDVLELCRHKPSRLGGILRPQPQRLQTAMSLYSNSLSGLVLMVDDRINSYTGIKRDFASVCQQSTDFHFPDLETQLRVIQQHALQANAKRRAKKIEKTSNDGESSSGSSGSERGSKYSDDGELSSNLKPGDFYITRHSNLSEVHVLFHLVSNDSAKAMDINSRHPSILALRNILKCAVQFDIHSITLPLFLVYEMYEEMTIQWCLKRAELIFKCIKGFMMEMATWGGNETRTVQFVVPKGISEDLFSQLSAMLPNIFRMSRTLDLTVTQRK